jgi:GTPase SAR1 family protein
MRYEKATYHEAILPEHKGNPLIEALPPKIGVEALLEAFSNYPNLDVQIKKHPDPLVRDEYTSRLKELRQPLPIYYECFRAIERALKNGYSSKNPLSPTTAQFLHYPVDERPDIAPHTGFFEPKGDGLTLVGESGVGKTSMLEQLLNYFTPVIKHDSYQGKKMELTDQVVWIKVDCPHNSSVRDLCEEILASMDLTLGLEKTIPATTIGKLIRQIEQIIKSRFLGIIVIDEMQRLVFKRTGGENNLLNFIHSLMNKLGVPIFFCANPPFNETLARTFKAARRAESGGYFTMELLDRKSDAWDAFISELWDIQWTSVYNELTDELNNKIYELSVGNLDLAHRIYRDAQRLVIGTGDERITVAVLENAYSLACGLSSQKNEIQLRRQENRLPRRNKNNPEQISDDSKLANKKKAASAGDITRAQHPEFEMQLREIQGAVDLVNRIKDPDLFQRASEEDNTIEYLRRYGMVCDDPLKQFY